MTKPACDAVVVGAGQAGLGVSYFLKQAGLAHRVLERGQIGETWRTQRWKSFVLNSTNAVSVLPGDSYGGSSPEGFHSLNDTITLFSDYAQHHQLPVETGVCVNRLESAVHRQGYLVSSDTETIFAANVVIATGSTNRPRIPAMSSRLPQHLQQIHAADYRDSSTLSDGAILIVGSGASGTQIAEDLAIAGRKVFLATSRVGRVPRRYRGRDISTWNHESGFIYEPTASLPDPAMRFAPAALQSGSHGGRSLNLRSLSAQGVTLLGKLAGGDGENLYFADDLQPNIQFSDEFAEDTKQRVDRYIQNNSFNIPEDIPDWEETVSPQLPEPPLRSLDIKTTKLSAVVWCTGFDGDFSWVHLPIFDERGNPKHREGVTAAPGVYFTGLPWLSTRASHLIQGVRIDAERVAGYVCAQAN